MKKTIHCILIGCAVASMTTSCSDDPDDNKKDEPKSYSALYVLDEGGFGAGNASLDAYDLHTGTFTQDVYSSATGKRLGDTGSDLQYHNGCLFAVMNGSGKVIVTDVYMQSSVAEISIESPRKICFNGDKAYVSSFTGGENGKGSVKEIDLNTYTVTKNIPVSYEPEGVAVHENRLYVANSCGYHLTLTDDSYISVIALSDYSELPHIDLHVVNLENILFDSKGHLWVSSRGNYSDVPSRLYRIDRSAGNVYNDVYTYNMPCSNMTATPGRLYFYASVWDNSQYKNINTFRSINLNTLDVETSSYISTDAAAGIQNPYGLAVDRFTGDIFISDACDYTNGGKLFCFDKNGALKHEFTTGVNPGHLTLVPAAD